MGSGGFARNSKHGLQAGGNRRCKNMVLSRGNGMQRVVFISLATLLTVSGGHAADIGREPAGGDIEVITVTGVLNEGDEDTFRKIAANSGQAVVVLNSEGGLVKTGIEIGRAIRLRGFATAVPPRTLCASACALTWLAGSPRYLDDTSKLGFHAAYSVVDGKASESGVGNALVGAYLNQIGLRDCHRLCHVGPSRGYRVAFSLQVV